MNLLLHQPAARLSQPCKWYRHVICTCNYSDRSANAPERNRTRDSSRRQHRDARQQQSFSGNARLAPRKRPDQKQQDRVGNLQLKHNYLVSCHPGLEQVTAAELQQPGLELIQQVEVLAPGRVAFSTDSLLGGYAAALHVRSATRVLQLIHEEQLNPDRAAGDTVYEATLRAAQWQDLVQQGQTLGVHCLHFYNNSNVTHSQLVARRVRDAVCDAVRAARGVRPAPPEAAPDVPLVFQMLNDKLQLFRDLGGGSLHRRGYRTGAAVHKAALNEAAAAGLLLLAEWDKKCQATGVILADPMCGSGTFLVEAALIATQTAPGLLRQSWPFQAWHDHDRQVQAEWDAVLDAARQQSMLGMQEWQHAKGCILGNDTHQGVLKLASQSADVAGMSQVIKLSHGSCGAWKPSKTPHMVVTNPPWGKRLLSEDSNSSSWQGGRDGHNSTGRQHQQHGDGEEESELAKTWHQLSSFLKQQCPGADAWVLSGSAEVTRHLGMRSCRKRSISIGGLKTAWLKYEVRDTRSA